MESEIIVLHKSVSSLKKHVKFLTLTNGVVALSFIFLLGVKMISSSSRNVGSVGNISINDNSKNKRARIKGYFTASEYADEIGVSLETVYRHIKQGKIEADKVNGYYQIPLN